MAHRREAARRLSRIMRQGMKLWAKDEAAYHRCAHSVPLSIREGGHPGGDWELSHFCQETNKRAKCETVDVLEEDHAIIQ